MIPSLATYRGSKPNRSHAALTDELMGNSFSSMAMVTFAPSAISFSVLDNPHVWDPVVYVHRELRPVD